MARADAHADQVSDSGGSPFRDLLTRLEAGIEIAEDALALSISQAGLAREIDVAIDPGGAGQRLTATRPLLRRKRGVEGEHDTFAGAAQRCAEVLGAEGLSEYRRLATAAWEALPPRAPARRVLDDPAVDRFRLAAILDFFAERDGDVEARIAIRARDLSSPWRYLELARFCLSARREAAALAWAEEGLWQFEDDPPDERLVTFAISLMARADRDGDAGALLWRAFERRPTLDLYRRLGELGGATARDRALSLLRASLATGEPARRWYSPADLLVRVLMAEAMFAEAWEAVHRHGASDALKESLAAQSETTRPGEALAVYRARVEQLVAAGGKGNYEQARHLIARMAPLGSVSEHAVYVATLKARFKAKRNFMKLLASQVTWTTCSE